MAESRDVGEQISPTYRRPTPHPRKQSGSPSPPVLPAKSIISSEKEVESRLGIVRQTSFPITPPSPLPSPPSLPERRQAPEPHPRSDEHIKAALAIRNDTAQTEESLLRVNAREPKLYANARAENVPRDSMSTFFIASGSPSLTENELLTVSANESALVEQTEELQMRSKLNQLPASDETASTKGYRASRVANAGRVSQFVSAVEKAAKLDKPPLVQKPGRLVVSTVLADKIGTCLSRQQTLKVVQQVEDLPDVVTSHTSDMSTAAGSTSTSTSEGTRSMLYSFVFLLTFMHF